MEKKVFFIKLTSGWTERIQEKTRAITELIARTNAARLKGEVVIILVILGGLFLACAFV